MKEIEEFLKKYDKPLSKEQLEKIIYNIFFIVIFMAPIIREIGDYGLNSLKCTIFNLATITTSIALLIINIKEIKLKKIKLYDWLIIVYLLFVILSTIFTNYDIAKCIIGTNGRGEGLITIFSYCMTFIIFSRGYKYMTKFSKVAIIAAIIVAIYGVLQANIPASIKLPFDKTRIDGVATGTMGNQNFLSSYLCIFLPMMCFYYINVMNKRKIAFISSILLFAALVYSLTLGGYITFSFMYIVIVIVSAVFSKTKKETIKRITILTTTLILVFVGINYINDNKHSNEFFSSSKEISKLANNDDDFGTGRMKIWKKSLTVISKYPLLGVGPDSMANELNDKSYMVNGTEDILTKYRVDKAHSEPLHIAVTTGIPSALIYLILAILVGLRLLILVVKNVKKYGMNKENVFMSMVLISMLSYLMQSMINISVIQVAPLFWAVFGTAAGITLNKKLAL